MNIAGELYAALVAEQLADERDVQESLQARGAAVVTTATALGTLLLSALAIAKSATELALDHAASQSVKAAVVLFVLAAAFGIATAIPRKHEVADPGALRRLATLELWGGDQPNASRRIAELKIKLLASARDRNRMKGILLSIAMVLEVLAIAAVGYAVVKVVT